MNESTERRKVLVTGAASGIGRATAARFIADGCDVAVNDINEQRLRNVFPRTDGGRDLLHCPGDCANAAAVAQIEGLLRTQWGRVDVLVHCAGVFRATDVVDTPIDQWRAAAHAMIDGALRMTRVVAPLMPFGGRIIHITSIHGQRAEPGASAYAVAKAAINQLCRALAVDLASRGILVNAIAPGFVQTAMSLRPDGTSELDSEWFKSNYVHGHHLPLRRAAQAEEIAGVAAFLAGPDATYITGQVITVDGGLSITF